MGWLRLVRSFKLYVPFAEYRLFYRALLQKRPIILRSLLIVATQYTFPQRSVDTQDMKHMLYKTYEHLTYEHIYNIGTHMQHRNTYAT